MYNFICNNNRRISSLSRTHIPPEKEEKIAQLQRLAQERSEDNKAYEKLRKQISWFDYLKVNRQMKEKLKHKEQENQNYLVRIHELEEQNALLRQELATEREVREITASLENQNLEENLERNPETELVAQIIQNPNLDNF